MMWRWRGFRPWGDGTGHEEIARLIIDMILAVGVDVLRLMGVIGEGRDGADEVAAGIEDV